MRKMKEYYEIIDYKEMPPRKAIPAAIVIAVVFWALVILGIMLPPLM